MNTVDFWNWFSEHDTELLGCSNTSRIVDQIHETVNRLDARFGVEVSEPDAFGTREMILSANGCRDLFSRVERIVTAAPKLGGWRFLALKPPRGFDFIFRLQGKALSPSEWSFLPLRDADKNLGLCVYIPGKQIVIDDAVLRTIIETGVGEKAFSEVHHLEYTQSPDVFAQNSWLRLIALPEYLQWQRGSSRNT